MPPALLPYAASRHAAFLPLFSFFFATYAIIAYVVNAAMATPSIFLIFADYIIIILFSPLLFFFSSFAAAFLLSFRCR